MRFISLLVSGFFGSSGFGVLIKKKFQTGPTQEKNFRIQDNRLSLIFTITGNSVM